MVYRITIYFVVAYIPDIFWKQNVFWKHIMLTYVTTINFYNLVIMMILPQVSPHREKRLLPDSHM